MSKKGFIIIFYCIVWLPLLLTVLGNWTEKRYDVRLTDNSGTVYTYPEFTFDNYLSGSFQHKFEGAWDSDFALHSVLTRTYNQIRFSGFGTNCSAGRKYNGEDLIIGKRKNIYEFQYIAEYMLIGGYKGFDTEESKGQMTKFVDLLEQVSNKLLSIDKKLVVLTTPNKCDYSYDDIPDHFKYRKGGTRGIDLLEEMLTETNVIYVSGRKLADQKEKDFPIFYHSGIHWSRPIEQYVSAEVIKLFGENIKYVELGELNKSDLPYGRDADVWNLLNIWEKPNELYYQYDESVIVPEQYENYRILIQGGSFAEGLRNMLIANNLSPLVQYINYDNALINMDGSIETHINHDWNNLDLKRALDNTDIVVVEMNENTIETYAYYHGFLECLNSFLDSYEPGRVNGITNLDFMQYWLNEKYSTYGIMRSEGDGSVWSGEYTYLKLENQDIISKGLEIDCYIPEQIFADNEVINFDIYINGCMAQKIACRPGDQLIKIDKEQLVEMMTNSCECEIEIYMPASFRPVDFGISGDSRELAIRFNYIGEVR